MWKPGGSGLDRIHTDDATTPAGAELDSAFTQCEESVVATTTDTISGMEVGTALTHDDLTSIDDLAAVTLDAETLSVRVTTEARGGRALLVCHV